MRPSARDPSQMLPSRSRVIALTSNDKPPPGPKVCDVKTPAWYVLTPFVVPIHSVPSASNMIERMRFDPRPSSTVNRVDLPSLTLNSPSSVPIHIALSRSRTIDHTSPRGAGPSTCCMCRRPSAHL